MSVDTPRKQDVIAMWTIIVGMTAAGGVFYFGHTALAKGILFGSLLMVLNFAVLSKLLRIAFSLSSMMRARIFAFLGYHIRFYILAAIMFVVITRQPFHFGVGTFIGFLIPKSIMGILVWKDQPREWWVESSPPKTIEKPLTPLEAALAKNPFAVDPVEFAIKDYLNKKGGE